MRSIAQVITWIRDNVPALQLGADAPLIPAWIEQRGGRTFWVDGDHPHAFPATWQATVAADSESITWTDGGQIQAYLCAARDHEDVDNAAAQEQWSASQAQFAETPAILLELQAIFDAELADPAPTAPADPETTAQAGLV